MNGFVRMKLKTSGQLEDMLFLVDINPELPTERLNVPVFIEGNNVISHADNGAEAHFISIL